ncbi:MAG: nucleoside hydrolase [Rhodobacteraceae bacterium]|nr:nucleoside hydrolase [Paracoccaceae bacterium]
MHVPRDIIIDTDPGQDDAVAMLLAFASEELRVLGITCVAGNVPLDLTSRNARIVCELANRSDIPVFAGCDRPLVRPLVTAEEVHGNTGLDGIDIYEPDMPIQDVHAVEFIIETLRKHPAGSVSLCPLGPLTNIALALNLAPDIGERVEQIVMMGGAYFEVGNVTPTAEFNVFVDPEAAGIVFRSGIPLTVLPLDATHKALATRPRLESLGRLGNKSGAAIVSLTSFYERFDRRKYGTMGAPLHDPCVIAHLLKPEIFSSKFVNVEVETASPLTLGMTVADWWGVTDRKANANFVGDVDADAFFELLTTKVASLP